MIVSMKLIHIGFDTTNGVIPFQLSSLEYYGYILNPASIIFGPFLTYKDYKQLLQGHKVVRFIWNICFILYLMNAKIWCNMSHYCILIEVWNKFFDLIG